MKKRLLALALTLCLLVASFPLALAAEKQVVSTGSAAAGECFTVTLEGKKLTLECLFGDEVITHPSVSISVMYWNAEREYYASGNDNEHRIDYIFETPLTKRDFTFHWTLQPSDEPIQLKVSVFNREGTGFSVLELNLEYIDGTYRFEQSPVLEQNQERSAQWVNIPQENADPKIQKLSDELCAKSDTDMEKLAAIHKWVCDNIYYDWDMYGGNVADTPDGAPSPYSALGTLENRRSVCAGYAALTRDLIAAQGIPCITTNGYALGVGTGGSWTDEVLAEPETINHAWNEAYVDGRWVILDTTWDSGGRYSGGEFTDGSTRMTYFDPSLELFSLDHRIAERGNEVYLPSDNPGGKATLAPADWAQDEIFQGMCANLYTDALLSRYGLDITRNDFCVQMIALVEAATELPIQDYLAKKGLTAQEVFYDSKTPEVLAAYALGIVSGKTDNALGLRFDPYGEITRQEAAVMLMNCAKVLGVATGTPHTFADGGEIAPWAAPAVAFISSLQYGTSAVMGDAGSGRFDPTGTYTYDQALVSALRLFRCT